MISTIYTDKSYLYQIINNNRISVDVIYDCGSRDALDGIELYKNLNAKEIHVFECNPPSVEICKQNLEKYLDCKSENFAWFLNNFAISDQVGEIDFLPIDTTKTVTPHPNGNPGASSIFKANGKYKKETYIQELIKVSVTTLNKYTEQRNVPDLLWMDLQGAELLALKGANKILKDVKIIHLEISFREMYHGQCLYWELDDFLKRNNFKQISIDIGRWPKWFYLYKILKTGPWLGNAIYINEKYT